MERIGKWTAVAFLLVSVGCTGQTTSSCPEGQRLNVGGQCVPDGNGGGGGPGEDEDAGMFADGGGGADTDGSGGGVDTGVAPQDTGGGGNQGPACQQYTDDDGDNHLCNFDNCPTVENADQKDGDGDGVGDVCDNCPEVSNGEQKDSDGNGTGDLCEEGAAYDATRDSDGDMTPDVDDNCPNKANPEQKDPDGDKLGNACDNCPKTANYDQADSNTDGQGDACTPKPVGQKCKEKMETFTRITPDVFIVLDKSGSMRGNKWSSAVSAIDAVANRLAGTLRMGLLAYSDRCSPSPLLRIGSHPPSSLKNAVRRVGPGGSTGTGGALNTVRQRRYYDGGGNNEKAVVLITDGSPNVCGGTSGSINAARALNNDGVNVYVIGFNFGSNTSTLDRMAKAGGTGKHITANNTQQLVNAITGIALKCEYKVQPPQQGVDPNKIWVSTNGMYVPQGEYSYDTSTNTLKLSQTACQQFQNAAQGQNQIDVKITFGCPTECQKDGEEICDYKDNDCDGDIDEGCEGCTLEVCDGNDNDCDGDIDEGCPMCQFPGEMCSSDEECCNGNCTPDGVCGPPCRPDGTKCTENGECCSQTCAGGGGGRVGQCLGQ